MDARCARPAKVTGRGFRQVQKPYLSDLVPDLKLKTCRLTSFLENMMNSAVARIDESADPQDWIAIARQLGQEFGERASAYDDEGSFIHENYADLRDYNLFSAGIPSELDGGGASYQEICGIIREIGRHCGSTGLTYAMHSHPVAFNILKYRNGDEKAKAALIKIATSEMIIAGTGANDWLTSNGEAVEAEGGYLVNAHNRYVTNTLSRVGRWKRLCRRVLIIRWANTRCVSRFRAISSTVPICRPVSVCASLTAAFACSRKISKLCSMTFR